MKPMEAPKTFYCSFCCDDTLHRYVNEDDSRKNYACTACDNGNFTFKAPQVVHVPKPIMQVVKGDKERVGKRR